MDTDESKIYQAVLIASSILGVVLLYFIFSLIRHQRRHLRLQREKIEAEIRTLENERRRIASDLHDEMGPMLSGIKLMMGQLSPDRAENQDLITRTQQYIDVVIDRMRTISNDLKPGVLERRGLTEAIRRYVEGQSELLPFEIVLEISGDIHCPRDKAIHIYRLIQEIIHNTAKHARAEKLAILLQADRRFIYLQTRDDGIGFDWQQSYRKGSGLGLRNMSSRVEILRGSLQIQSSPGAGTTIFIRIPIFYDA